MHKNIATLALTLVFMVSGLFTPAPEWMAWSVAPAYAHGGGGDGGENPNVRPARPSAGKTRRKANPDKHELPVPGEVRELGGLIVRGASALREANGNIDFLNTLESEVQTMGGITNERRAEALREIRRAKQEQEKSRAEIRAKMREAFSVIGVYLGNRNARQSLRDLARAQEAARRAENAAALVKLGNDGLTMIDNVRAANAAFEAVQGALKSAFGFSR